MDWKRRIWSRRLVQRWVIFAVKKKEKGCRTGSVAAYVQRVIKVKDLQFSPGPPDSLAPFQELLRMIYKEAELSACPNFHHFFEIKIKSSPTDNKNSRYRLSSQAKIKSNERSSYLSWKLKRHNSNRTQQFITLMLALFKIFSPFWVFGLNW